MLSSISMVIGGLLLLAWAAGRLVDGAAALARNLGVAPMIIGLTVVGLGTSAPEIVVSALAAWQGNAGLAIGNAIGSNIAKTDEYKQPHKDRKKVEMLFAHLKRILKLDRLRFRGLSGANDEFLLAATAQNLRRLAKRLSQPPPDHGKGAPSYG